MYTNEKVHFISGDAVKAITDAKYLGCVIQGRKPERVMNKRMADAYATWKKLKNSGNMQMSA